MIDYGEDRMHYLYPDVGKPVVLTVVTKSPQKWLLIDRETGQSYEGSSKGSWDKLIHKETNSSEEK
jgi:aminoglycoside phosphotransferase